MTDNFVRTVPQGDNRDRLVCQDCGYVEYTNPKIVVGAVATWEGKVLLCKRAIEPRLGFWTIPAGYMEMNESTAEGAARETLEETRAHIDIESLLGIYDIPHIGQVYVVYKAALRAPEFGPTDESSAVDLFAFDAVPWDELAFPSVRWALERFRDGDAPGVGVSPGRMGGLRAENG
jgi:ADP-ribose pyrophosphatase YjhB (NUDIX family)